MAKNVLSQSDLFKLGDFMRKHCATINGRAIYEEGWSDERLVEELSPTIPGITFYNVRGLRKVLIGELPAKAQPMTLEKAIERIDSLETQINALIDWAKARGPGRGRAFGDEPGAHFKEQ